MKKFLWLRMNGRCSIQERLIQRVPHAEWTITGQMFSKRNFKRVNSGIVFFRGLSKEMERNDCEENGGGHYLCQLFVLLS